MGSTARPKHEISDTARIAASPARDCGSSCPRSSADEGGSSWPSGAPVLTRGDVTISILSGRTLQLSSLDAPPAQRVRSIPQSYQTRFTRSCVCPKWLTASPRGEKRQQHFAFLADDAEELLRLPGLLSLQVDLTHDDRPHRRVLDLGVRLGDGECVHVEDDVLDRGRALFQGNEPCSFAGRDLRIIRRLSLSRS